MSVVDNTNRNKLNRGKSSDLDNRASTDDSKKNGISIFSTSRDPIKKGSKIVVNLYTESTVKDEIDAILPVPKNATLIKIKKKLATLKSFSLSCLSTIWSLLFAS